MVRKLLFIGILGAVSANVLAQKARLNLMNDGDHLSFEVSYNKKVVIPSSPLGLNVDNRILGKGVSVTPVMSQSENDIKTYEVKHTDGSLLYVDVRESDDGVAFRYRLPADGPKCIYGEQTTFTFPNDTKVWYASGPFQYGWIQAYQERNISTVDNELLAPPATFQLPDGCYAAITEANLFNFHGAVLLGEKGNKVRFGYVENKGHLETGSITGIPDARYYHEVVKNVPWIVYPTAGAKEIKTPWRILMLADDLNGLVNNKIIASVSDQPDKKLFPDGAKTSWIKPGRSVFTWLVEGPDRLSVANHKKYVDGAAELGLQSVVVDDGWELWPSTEPEGKAKSKWEYMSDLVNYAKAKGVDIWVWRPSSPRTGNKTDIGLNDPVERKAFMKKCAEVGIKGLKIDFFHTENLYTVNLMENILRDAAEQKLMVIFHGVNKPTGDCYTYPNLLAKEAVRGLECVGGEGSWAPGPAWPYHNTVLPFTRWLAGPADYTPLNFRAFCPPSVTFTHQLASIYMFTSPMLILAADMEDMLSCPGRKFIEEVPVVWDENYVLPVSKIGELAAIARRKGDVWYLSVLNGEQEKQVVLNLDFLQKGTYKVTYASDKGRKEIVVNETKVKSGRALKVNLLSGGAYLAKIERIK